MAYKAKQGQGNVPSSPAARDNVPRTSLPKTLDDGKSGAAAQKLPNWDNGKSGAAAYNAPTWSGNVGGSNADAGAS